MGPDLIIIRVPAPTLFDRVSEVIRVNIEMFIQEIGLCLCDGVAFYQFKVTGQEFASAGCKSPTAVLSPQFTVDGKHWKLKLWLCLSHLHFTSVYTGTPPLSSYPSYKLRILPVSKGK